MFGETLLHPANYVHFAGVLYALGLLVRDELRLRLLILAGTMLYIAYYYLHPVTPLWGAIAVSIVLGAANITILIAIVFERTIFAMDPGQRALFTHFHTLNPGQFRKIMKLSEPVTAKTTAIIAAEGAPLKRLYFLVGGPATASKNGSSFSVEGGEFIGEISFITGSSATATVTVGEGAELIAWDHDKLMQLLSRKPALRNALLALFNHDLASKLANSQRASVDHRTTVKRSAARVTAV